ncbi:HPr kinase/phosphorylase (EC 2.7.4.-) [Candidatus Phaeomarinobacter ectocarpi]|uniref:HPr kinase/phosphorylase n=1 Tax=Candidatus Phaeomarinibacter ectocarpi TaxID=1458461 RepID=X5M9A6_9HYPH|nr:HPr kinase/phosphatase C-terminal domain-containing protein [Candidatus Phaeomarinobacter ectocarpi]CDO60073.1 HPr kinase/phosphorylase (EC 2.7.4.-) [Candidatus Phaeomarinobacter ectocarpi]
MTDTHHATCVARRGRAALLRGPSGSGKSDLAFRFLETYSDAWLIADDQVILSGEGTQVYASAPTVLKGLLEVRGLGLVSRAVPAGARLFPVALIVDMTPGQALPRIAEPRFERVNGVDLPVIPLAAFEVSAPHKLALALETIGQGHFPGDDGRVS